MSKDLQRYTHDGIFCSKNQLNRFLLLIFDLDDTLFRRLPDNYTPQQLKSITLFPFILEILQRKDIHKVLVTKGDPLAQYEKLKILGIKKYFDLILIPSTDLEKKTCFAQARQTFPAEQIYVIGDRIDSEIQFGNELGLTTILFRQGKYKDLALVTPAQIPQYSITSYQELQKIIQ